MWGGEWCEMESFTVKLRFWFQNDLADEVKVLHNAGDVTAPHVQLWKETLAMQVMMLLYSKEAKYGLSSSTTDFPTASQMHLSKSPPKTS